MINIQGLQKQYPGFCLDLSLQLPKGRVTGIVGRNGAGKSTTIKAILGIVQPDGGTVTVLGREASRLTGADRCRIGVALAESGFSNYINIRCVVRILRAMYPSFDQAAFLAHVQHAKLPLDEPIKDFSTGMKAKLRVLSAISHNAELLVLDEPTAGLDVVARNEILDLLRAYMAQDENRSLLITSHISSDLEGLCDDIYMINDGHVVLHEETDRLLSNYALLKVTKEQYANMDRRYLLSVRKRPYGYACLTGEKQFYKENDPSIVMENGSIDDLILMLSQE